VHGFHGRYWRFDLTTGRGAHVAIDEAVLRRFLGGSGLGAWLLHREAPRGVDPFAPEAPLVFAFSPLVGTPLTTSAKFAVVAKSPLTGCISDALSSSHFAIAGKRLGVDALVITGACREPSELVCGDLRATPHWGKTSAETEAALASHGRVASIGVAGENLVRYATISNEGRHAGRGGLGAVMGAKKLKAIVVRGDVPTPLADPARVYAIAKDLSKRSFGPATAKYRELGTVANLLTFNRLNALPTRNFQASAFEDAPALSAERLAPVREKAQKSCASCTIGCEHIWDGTRMEYESLFALGPMLGVGDPDAVIALSRRCDELGLDTISAGGTIAFAMELTQRGLLDGPRFGEVPLPLLDDIAHRRGLGALLAEGSKRVAEQRGGADFAPHVKGLELPGYDPRTLQTMALGFAVGTRGADHNRSGAYELDFSERVDRFHGTEDAARLAIGPEDRAALIDSLILCKFLRGVFTDLFAESADMLRAVTGWEVTADELRATAARIVNLKKAFNMREGWTPASDTLPARLFSDAFPRERLERMVRAYNLARGWTEDGRLTEAQLAELP